MSDVQTVAVAVGTTISIVVAARAWVVVRLCAIRAGVAANASEFVMIQKAAQPRKVKAHKTPAPTPYGL